MKRLKRAARGAAILAGLYLFLPLAIFDFSSTAYHFEEEHFDGKTVAIGPRPWWWVPGASHSLDIPGGFDYDTEGWPFVLWKPMCLAYVKNKGFALPSAWR